MASGRRRTGSFQGASFAGSPNEMACDTGTVDDADADSMVTGGAAVATAGGPAGFGSVAPVGVAGVNGADVAVAAGLNVGDGVVVVVVGVAVPGARAAGTSSGEY